MVQLIRGFRDILPGDVEIWQHIEKTAISIFTDFGFKEVRIPILEKTELFERSIGADTDIVEKEMYTFPDRKGDLITMRPEATASLVRSYIQHKMYASDPVRKFYTIGPMFRRERPQKGRYRQFYQINAEVFGVESAFIDAQLILMLITLFKRLNVADLKAHINSLGCPDCRPGYKDVLGKAIEAAAGKLCADCTRRKDRNPLRVLDCKSPSCQEALSDPPLLIDYLCDACRQHFNTLTRSLQNMNIDFIVDARLVRGLDYYTRSTFEIQSGALGAQSAVAGGGRYDGLIKLLGGPDLPATGFAIGFDRLAEISGLDGADYIKTPVIFIAALGEECIARAFEWTSRLGLEGIHAEMDFSGKSLKSQMKRADKLNVKYTLIFGDTELQSGKAILKNMATSEQHEIDLDHAVETIVSMASR